MKSIKKIFTVFASTCLILSSCDIDPILTKQYPSDIIFANETNLNIYKWLLFIGDLDIMAWVKYY